MNEQTLQILDQSLRMSLWVFLVIFIACLTFIALRLRARQEKLADYFSKEFDERYQREITGSEPESRLRTSFQLSTRLPMVAQALALSCLLSLICFLVIAFTPFSPLSNFANSDLQGSTPLRLTFLSYERFHDGFSLQGEVWNQSQQPIDGLRALVQIFRSGREILDQVPVVVEPDPLSAESAGFFSIRYTEKSPFLYGYKVTFQSQEGTRIPHVEGFDVD
jgi:hypothetical protein